MVCLINTSAYYLKDKHQVIFGSQSTVNYSIVSLLLAHSIQVIFSSDPPNVILCIILFGKTEEYEKCMVGLNAITSEAWNTQDTEDKREKYRHRH